MLITTRKTATIDQKMFYAISYELNTTSKAESCQRVRTSAKDEIPSELHQSYIFKLH